MQPIRSPGERAVGIRLPPHLEASYAAARAVREAMLEADPLDVEAADVQTLEAYYYVRGRGPRA